eukprot:3643275-Prymnesium_polylepis.1
MGGPAVNRQIRWVVPGEMSGADAQGWPWGWSRVDSGWSRDAHDQRCWSSSVRQCCKDAHVRCVGSVRLTAAVLRTSVGGVAPELPVLKRREQ